MIYDSIIKATPITEDIFGSVRNAIKNGCEEHGFIESTIFKADLIALHPELFLYDGTPRLPLAYKNEAYKEGFAHKLPLKMGFARPIIPVRHALDIERHPDIRIKGTTLAEILAFATPESAFNARITVEESMYINPALDTAVAVKPTQLVYFTDRRRAINTAKQWRTAVIGFARP